MPRPSDIHPPRPRWGHAVAGRLPRRSAVQPDTVATGTPTGRTSTVVRTSMEPLSTITSLEALSPMRTLSTSLEARRPSSPAVRSRVLRKVVWRAGPSRRERESAARRGISGESPSPVQVRPAADLVRVAQPTDEDLVEVVRAGQGELVHKERALVRRDGLDSPVAGRQLVRQVEVAPQTASRRPSTRTPVTSGFTRGATGEFGSDRRACATPLSAG